jgi:hypothetical protein
VDNMFPKCRNQFVTVTTRKSGTENMNWEERCDIFRYSIAGRATRYVLWCGVIATIAVSSLFAEPKASAKSSINGGSSTTD